MGWRIEKQSNGKFAVYSTRIDDYVVIDAEPLAILQLYAEKGVKVYLASAQAQLAKEITVSPEGEAKIEASRKRGSLPDEGEVPIGATGFAFSSSVPRVPRFLGSPSPRNSEEPEEPEELKT